MIKLLKISFIILAFTLLANKGFSQTSISYYNSADSKIGLSHNFTEKLWGEARVYTTFEEYDAGVELVMCYNALRKENYSFYFGLGAMLKDYNGFIVPIGVQFAPFEKFKELSLHVELQPEFSEYDNRLQSSIGIRYTFGKKQ